MEWVGFLYCQGKDKKTAALPFSEKPRLVVYSAWLR